MRPKALFVAGLLGLGLLGGVAAVGVAYTADDKPLPVTHGKDYIPAGTIVCAELSGMEQSYS